MTKRTRKEVKAWAVILNDALFAVYPTEGIAHMEKERLQYPEGKHRAFNPYPGIKVIPCTITYDLT